MVKYLGHGYASSKLQSKDLNLVSLLNLHFFVLEQFMEVDRMFLEDFISTFPVKSSGPRGFWRNKSWRSFTVSSSLLSDLLF